MLFWKISFFRKCSSSERVDAVQKYLLQKSSSSVYIFILNNSSTKKVAVPKSNCFKEPAFKTWLLGISFVLKNGCSEKASAAETISDCSEKGAPQKKQILFRNSCSDKVTKLLCWSIYSEEVLRSSFSQNKSVLKKTDSLTLRVFMGILIWLLIRVAGTDRERNHRLCLYPTIFLNFYSCMCHKQRTV